MSSGEDRWVAFRSGPVEVYSQAGPRAGRTALIRIEQFRYALGRYLGEDDLQAAMPLRVLVFGKRQPLNRVIEGRDRYALVLRAEIPPSADVQRDLARLLIETGARMPAAIERGLAELFSTFEVKGIRPVVGRPPARPDPDWARMHLLAVSPDYYGKLRVVLSNLRKGIPAEVAYRNAVGKSPAEIEAEAARHLAADNFGTADLTPRAMSERDFPERPVEPAAARLAVADLLLERAAYQALLRDKLYPAESHEGLGLIALREGNRDEARREFAAAMAAGSQSARAFMEYARLEPDDGKALAALRQAAKLNPKLAEARFLMAQREPEPAAKIANLKAAAALAPRQATYWEALANAYLEQKNFGEAARAWTAAEQAASDAEARERYRKARAAIEQQRLDWEAEERRRAAEEERRQIEKLKAQAQAEVRALEERMNRGASAAADKPVPWWEGPKPAGRAAGTLKQLDCIGKQARLIIEDANRKLMRLLVPDPAQIAVIGGGEKSLQCGPQTPRQVSVEYFPKNNAKLATVGEVATIRFE